MKTPAFAWVVIAAAFGVPSLRADERTEFFEKRIRPVLVEHCVECHGPQKSESDLRLDHGSFLTREGTYGPVLVRGKPEQSMLFVSLTHKNEDLLMPLDRERLQAEVITDFRKWISGGAFWPDEAVPDGLVDRFDLPARKQRLPWIWKTPGEQTVPAVEDTAWPRSDLDHFILSRLRSEGLQPAADAAPEVWLRRVYFATIGLPPTPQQIHEFLSDSSQTSREAVVDRLLDSPHFGERWARHWLDLVRYAESRGHESDFAIANAWHYRDYVIRALNEDLPYDQFVVEHVAGDLLESPRLNRDHGFNESILATAWPFFGEEVHSPVDIRQDECERLDNKIDVFSKTFLGLTVACARCHDHKFDAISQEDYYSLAGYLLSSHFRQVRFQSMEHNRRISDKLESLELQTQRRLGQLLAETFRPHLAEAAKQFDASALNAAGSIDSAERVIDFSDSDHVWRASGNAFGQSARSIGDFVIPADPGDPITEVRMRGAAVRDPIWNSLKLAGGNEADSGSLDAVGRSAGFVSTPTFVLNDGRVHVLMKGETRLYCAVDSHLMITGPLHKKLVSTLTASEQKWVTVDLRAYQGHRVHLEFGPVDEVPLSIFEVSEGPTPPADVNSAEPRFVGDLPLIEKLLTDAIDAAANGTAVSREHAAVINWLMDNVDDIGVTGEFIQKQANIVGDYQSQRAKLAVQIQNESLTAIALMDSSGVDEHLLKRGKYQSPGDASVRGLPDAFGYASYHNSKDSGRLDLAEHLVDPNNPLVARVMVNRIWHHLFGRGIVESVDNFGWLGSRPSHPELLDHLAFQFVNDDEWSIKAMIKRLLLSRTFAMSSRRDDPAAETADPKNLLLHRMPVRRLEAEVIRDSLLAISGRLDRKVGGKPVPVHLTEFVIGRGRPGKSGPLDGEGRRSIYTSVRRNFLPTMMLTFDMPIPFSTVGKRNVTNVPAQTLALMNDKLVYEQAAVWAAALPDRLPDGDSEARIRHMYLQAFGREATTNEFNAALETLEELAQLHGGNSNDVKVWADLCHAMFRVNEFIYVR